MRRAAFSGMSFHDNIFFFVVGEGVEAPRMCFMRFVGWPVARMGAPKLGLLFLFAVFTMKFAGPFRQARPFQCEEDVLFYGLPPPVESLRDGVSFALRDFIGGRELLPSSFSVRPRKDF